MKAVDHIEPPDWAVAEAAQAVLAALRANGGEVRFVGGCVRNHLIGKPVIDVDLATSDPPERVMELLEKAGLKAVPTGIAHGTVTAVSHGYTYEITTLRHDVETYGRHAKVAYTDDWLADAARRDFTFNALSLDTDGALYDPFDGRADLLAGRVRFVGEARRRIEEDYLRLLRFFRFYALFGRGEPDAEGLAAATELAPHLERLSGERLRAELLKLLAADDPLPATRLMIEHGVLTSVLPEVASVGNLAALVALQIEAPRPDPLLRLAALLPMEIRVAEAAANRLRLSRAESERLTKAGTALPDLDLKLAPETLATALYREGAQRVGDVIRLTWARAEAMGHKVDAALAAERLAFIQDWRPKIFPLKGRDAVDLGVPEGPDVGHLLAAVETWWIEQGFVPDRAACLAQLQSLKDEA